MIRNIVVVSLACLPLVGLAAEPKQGIEGECH